MLLGENNLHCKKKANCEKQETLPGQRKRALLLQLLEKRVTEHNAASPPRYRDAPCDPMGRFITSSLCAAVTDSAPAQDRNLFAAQDDKI